MHLVPKRLLLIGVAPFALAAVYGGSLAFAQSGEDPTPTPTEDAAPTTPDSTAPDSTAPDSAPGSTSPGRGGCPDKGGSGGGTPESDSTEPDTSTQIRTRASNPSSRGF